MKVRVHERALPSAQHPGSKTNGTIRSQLQSRSGHKTVAELHPAFAAYGYGRGVADLCAALKDYFSSVVFEHNPRIRIQRDSRETQLYHPGADIVALNPDRAFQIPDK